MCGRYSSSANSAQLVDEFDIDDIVGVLPGPDYNVAMLLLAVTPGGSGIAEGAFPVFFGRFMGTAAMTSFMVLLYRVVTYYFYLALGLAYLPRWAGRVFGNTPEKIVESAA